MMATGYVHNMLDKNQNFEQFTLSCARAFGALIEMRDEPMDAPIPDAFQPSDYHAKEQAKAEAELERFGAMSKGERREWGTAQLRELIAYWRKAEAEELDKINRCKEMLARVAQWQPPTPDHEGLKKFGYSETSVDFDSPGH